MDHLVRWFASIAMLALAACAAKEEPQTSQTAAGVRVRWLDTCLAIKNDAMSHTNDNSPGQTIAPTAEDAAEETEGTRLLVSRRAALGCMAWAGAGILWTVSGGVPRSLGLIGEAEAATKVTSFTFVQISDTHIGFNKEANPDVVGTLRRAMADVNALKTPPAFVLHTGD